MPTEIHGLLFSLVLGLAGGFFYFAGLWWTVRRMPAARYPALWTFGSFWLRSAVVVTMFYLVMQGRWERLLMCLLGFAAARVLVLRRVQHPAAAKTKPNR